MDTEKPPQTPYSDRKQRVRPDTLTSRPSEQRRSSTDRAAIIAFPDVSSITTDYCDALLLPTHFLRLSKVQAELAAANVENSPIATVSRAVNFLLAINASNKLNKHLVSRDEGRLADNLGFARQRVRARSHQRGECITHHWLGCLDLSSLLTIRNQATLFRGWLISCAGTRSARALSIAVQ